MYSSNLYKTSYDLFKTLRQILGFAVKDVYCRQKLTTDFFQTFRVDYFGFEYLNFEKKICLPWLPGGHFLRGLITKS